jgi:hypothetical protein
MAIGWVAIGSQLARHLLDGRRGLCLGHRGTLLGSSWFGSKRDKRRWNFNTST